MLHAAAALVVLLLVGFHALLFWQRIEDQSLFEPIPALRWLATAVLVAALYRLHRRGLSVIRGRGALVLWLLVLLLHVSFWGPMAEPASSYADWTGSGLMLGVPAITLVLGIVLVAIRRSSRRSRSIVGRHALSVLGALDPGQSFPSQAGVLPVLACRPPPVC